MGWKGWGVGRLLLALMVGVALALAMAPNAGVAVGPPPQGSAAAPPAPSPPSAGAGEPLASQGAYQLGKVRILGVPVITVASPVLSGAGTGPDATTRAQVIEGNLAMLYRGRNLCSPGEALAEALVHRFLAPDTTNEPCGLANASLLGPPDALTLEVVQQQDGLHRLEAWVAGRPQPLPLLTVTPEDARLNGLSNGALAQRWQGLLQERLRLARKLMQPKELRHRLAHVVAVEMAFLALLAVSLWCWRWCRQRARGRGGAGMGPEPRDPRTHGHLHQQHLC